MTKSITVICVIYNKGSATLASIQSLLNQSEFNIDILIVDDGSNDALTTECLEKIEDLKDLRVKLVRQRNMGFTNSLFVHLKNVETPYIAIHGAGDISLPNRLEIQRKYLDAHPKTVIVGCQSRSQTKCGVVVKQSRFVESRLLNSEEAIQRNIFSHGEVMFRTQTYRRAGGYRPFFKYAQDRDLWIRMLRYGEGVSLNETLYHQVHLERSSISTNGLKIEMQRMYSEFAKYLGCGESGASVLFEEKELQSRFGDFIASRVFNTTHREVGGSLFVSFKLHLIVSGVNRTTISKLTQLIRYWRFGGIVATFYCLPYVLLYLLGNKNNVENRNRIHQSLWIGLVQKFVLTRDRFCRHANGSATLRNVR